ncbi:MAG: EamA family transporter [Clostridia bacterium]|nr:EamA family transporter [Clostridia bacterium]
MKSSLLILAGGVLWGIIGLFVRYLTPLGFTAMQLVALRSYITVVGLVLILLFTQPQKLKIRFKDFPLFLGTGLLSFVFFNTCYFKTMEYASLSVAAILLYTAPFFVMGMSAIFFREKVTKHKLFALMFAFLGCVLVSGAADRSVQLSPIGLLWGLGAGFGYALYSVFAKFALKKYDTLTVITYTFIVASVGATFLCQPTEMIHTLSQAPKSVWVLVLYGITTGAGAYYCYTKGLENTPPAKASVLATVEPVVAAVCGFLLGETITVSGGAGILMVLCSVLYLQRQT